MLTSNEVLCKNNNKCYNILKDKGKIIAIMLPVDDVERENNQPPFPVSYASRSISLKCGFVWAYPTLVSKSLSKSPLSF